MRILAQQHGLLHVVVISIVHNLLEVAMLVFADEHATMAWSYSSLILPERNVAWELGHFLSFRSCEARADRWSALPVTVDCDERCVKVCGSMQVKVPRGWGVVVWLLLIPTEQNDNSRHPHRRTQSELTRTQYRGSERWSSGPRGSPAM